MGKRVLSFTDIVGDEEEFFRTYSTREFSVGGAASAEICGRFCFG
jgi:hypothetical protein